jgi:hypothetical protein
MDDDIGAVVQWVLNIGRQEGIVNNDKYTVLVSNCGNIPDIYKAESRV